MLSNLNWNVIPTKERVQANKPALLKLEKKLKTLLKSCNDVEQEIAQYQAWAAPIRRIPEEVLSIIFIDCARDAWKVPLILGGVCRQWRAAVLHTPRVWAFLEITPTSTQLDEKLLDLWLSRCGALTVHASLRPVASPAVVQAVCQNSKNIQCLSFFNNSKQLKKSFPKLEELRLGPYNQYMLEGASSVEIKTMRANEVISKKDDKNKSISLLSVKRFPKLLSLHLHGPSDTTMQAIARKSSFPPLQMLHIHILGAHWHRIIQHCAETLVTLVLEMPPKFTGSIVPMKQLETTIILPRLQHLAYIIMSMEAVRTLPLPTLETPVLQSYQEANPQGASPLHKDVASVTCFSLAVPERVNLSSFVSLAQLRLCATSTEINQILKQLADNPKWCPQLSFVNILPTSRPLMARATALMAEILMENRISATGKPIKVQHFSSSGSFVDTATNPDYFMCLSFCACEAPGHPQEDFYSERCHYYDESDLDSEIYSSGLGGFGSVCDECGEIHDF